VFRLWIYTYFFPYLRIVNFRCSHDIFLLMFSSVRAAYCRAERYPHVGVPFEMKDLAAFIEVHTWVTWMTFSLRTFCDTTHSKCVYLKRRHKWVEVRHEVWGSSLSVILHPAWWTWSFPTFWTRSTKSVCSSEMWTSFQQIT
jgi:hypothetical protein